MTEEEWNEMAKKVKAWEQWRERKLMEEKRQIQKANDEIARRDLPPSIVRS